MRDHVSPGQRKRKRDDPVQVQIMDYLKIKSEQVVSAAPAVSFFYRNRTWKCLSSYYSVKTVDLQCKIVVAINRAYSENARQTSICQKLVKMVPKTLSYFMTNFGLSFSYAPERLTNF